MSNTKKPEEVEDFLTEDPEIPSQKVVLLSFLSPEKILEKKEVFFFQEFLKSYEVQWRTSRLEAWLAQQISDMNTKLEKLAGSLEFPPKDLSGAPTPAQEVRANLLRVDRLVEEFQQYVRKANAGATTDELKEAYDDFLFKNGTKLEDQFFAQNEFRTSIRGIKVRGVFSSEAEASVRAKRLQKSDPYVDILMGTVGKWMAWDPNPNSGIKSEYANEQLNNLMKKYQENEDAREEFYSEQKTKRIGGAKTRSTEETPGPASTTTGVDSTSVKEASIRDTPFGGAESGNFDAMFSETADLSIKRKMDAKKESKDE